MDNRSYEVMCVCNDYIKDEWLTSELCGFNTLRHVTDPASLGIGSDNGQRQYLREPATTGLGRWVTCYARDPYLASYRGGAWDMVESKENCRGAPTMPLSTRPRLLLEDLTTQSRCLHLFSTIF